MWLLHALAGVTSYAGSSVAGWVFAAAAASGRRCSSKQACIGPRQQCCFPGVYCSAVAALACTALILSCPPPPTHTHTGLPWWSHQGCDQHGGRTLCRRGSSGPADRHSTGRQDPRGAALHAQPAKGTEVRIKFLDGLTGLTDVQHLSLCVCMHHMDGARLAAVATAAVCHAASVLHPVVLPEATRVN